MSLPIAERMDSFLERSSWIRRMFEEGAKLRAQHGPDKVFDFSLGNPSLDPPPEFHKVLAGLAADCIPGSHGYMPNAGYDFARQAVAEYFSSEQQVDVPAANIVMTAGSGGALNVIFKAILDEGDEVLVSAPYFVEYDFYVTNHGGVLRSVPSTPEFDLDVEAVTAAISPRTRAVLLNSPNNPTGRVYNERAIRALGRLVEEASLELGRTVYLVSDEPYRKIVYDGITVPPTMGACDYAIVATSYSKDLSLPGERIGFLAAHPAIPGVEKLMSALIMANRILGFVNAPALMQRVVSQLQGLSVDITHYRQNRDLLYRELTAAGFSVPRPEGAFYLFPKAPVQDDVAFCRELQEHLVLVVPGSGFAGPGHFRMCYCVSREAAEGALPVFREIGRKYFG